MSASAQTAQVALGGRADRSVIESKLDQSLMFALRGLSAVAGMSQVPPMAQAGVQTFVAAQVAADQTIFVVIKGQVTSALMAAVQGTGAYDIAEFAQYNTITARVPYAAILGLAAHGDVVSIGPQELHETERYIPPPGSGPAFSGSISNAVGVSWEGMLAHKVAQAHSIGIIGTGVKVCVISNGIDSLTARQASGELGTVTVLPGQAGIGDEGTAMLEIVHDMAPGATLFFATANPSAAQFATNILALRNSAGCDIIVDDVTYFNEGAFQDGAIAQAVNTVVASGALYFSSASNSGNLTHATSGTYEGDFVASAAAVPAAIADDEGTLVTLHSFGALPYTTLTVATATVSLKWSDPLGAAVNDYDLYVMDSTGTNILWSSAAFQSTTLEPVEIATCTTTAGCKFPIGSRIYVVRYSGAARALRVDTHRGRLTAANATAGSTYGHHATTGAIGVAAVDVRTASGGAFVGGVTNPVTTYSSDGPRKMFYNPNGSAITPGNLLFGSNGGTTLRKVDLAASDCGTTTTPGFAPFCGTSAAAPTAAALAALVKSAHPGYDKTKVLKALQMSALDIEAAGVDRDSGVGIIMTSAIAARVGSDLTPILMLLLD
jgi:hypothetical protein